MSNLRIVGIDPATNTGFVALDEQANVLVATSLRGVGPTIPGGISIEQMVSLQDQLYRLLQPGDEIVIEDAAAGTQKGITTGMIHGCLRSMIYRKGLTFNVVSPTGTKKFVGVTGWKGETGSKVRLKDKEKKDAMKSAVLAHFDWTHKSHDVIDAFVIARIALNLWRMREFIPPLDIKPYQIEVVKTILKTE